MGKKTVSLKSKFIIITTIVIVVQFILNVVLYHCLGNFEYINQKMSKEVYYKTLNSYKQLESSLTAPAGALDREANHIAESIEAVILSDASAYSESEEEIVPFSEKFDSLSGNSPKITAITASVEKSLLSVLSDDTISGAFIILDTNVSKKENSHSALYLRKTDKGVSVIYGNNAKTSLDRTRKIADEIDFSLESEETGVSYSFYSKPALYKKKSLAHSGESFTYWAAPHSLFEGEERVISYSKPVVSSDGTFMGVIGFEVSEKTIKSLIPADSLGFGNSGFALFERSNGMIDLSKAIATGVSVSDIENISHHPIITELEQDFGQNVSRLENENGTCSYLYTHHLNFYDEQSYFAENEEWLLVGTVPEKYITKHSSNVRNISVTVMLSSALVALLISVLIIASTTSRISGISKTIESSKHDRSKPIVVERTGIKEIDAFSEIIESYSENIVVNSSKKSKIVDLLSDPIATFEINKNEDKVFVSNSIVNMLQLNPAIIINGYINKKEWESIYSSITLSENISYEGSYHINKEKGNGNSGQWLKINTYESDDYIIGVITDISEKILERKRMEYENSHDALTGIINRKTFLLRAEEILSNCKNAVVALWDIKNIKFINNKYGHENGDKLIKAATRVLDSVSNDKNTITARLSGDEFVTIFFGEKDVSFYKKEVKNLYELLSNVVIETPDDTEIRIEAAVGTACYPFDAPDIKGLLRCTDSTLLINKNENGRHSDGIFEYKAY